VMLQIRWAVWGGEEEPRMKGWFGVRELLFPTEFRENVDPTDVGLVRGQGQIRCQFGTTMFGDHVTGFFFSTRNRLPLDLATDRTYPCCTTHHTS
jgi:hypothetical protein